MPAPLTSPVRFSRPVILLHSADVHSVKVYTESTHGSGCGTAHSRCGGGGAAARSNNLHSLLAGLQSCCKNSEECSCRRRSLPLSAAAPACLHLRVEVRARHLALGGVAHVRLQPKVIEVSGHRLVQRMRGRHAGQPLHTAQPERCSSHQDHRVAMHSVELAACHVTHRR